MPTAEFERHRAELQQARQALQANQAALLLARERSQRLTAEQAALERTFDEADEDHRQRREALAARRARTSERVAGLRDGLGRLQADLGERLERFLPLTDPRDQLQELSDLFPVLLLPLRLEIRFKQLPDPDGTRHELWVRAYPDDCAVDTFEATLSEAEVRHARTFWALVWRAGDDETERRAAWRGLVASHGSGRAQWITRQYRPLDEPPQPGRPPGTVILVIPTTTRLPTAEEDAAATFWEAVWRAEDAAAAADAQAELVEAVGAVRAAELVSGYRPLNLDDPPPPDRTRATTTVVVTSVVFQPDEDIEVRRNAWSSAPHVDVMPDRLVLLGYVADELVVSQLGQPIPTPLIVGPDPQAEPGEGPRQEGEGLVLGEDLRWMVEFDEAVDKGMGFRLSLSAADAARGFDRLLVLGVRLSCDPADGQRLLEALFEHHHASRVGLSLLPQGAPTNNTEEGGAGFSGGDDADASYPSVAGQIAAFDPDADRSEWPDGQHLAYWLGVEPASLERVPHAGRTDVRDAQAMNLAMWPATIGYWMDTMLSSVFDDRAVELTRRFFTRFVSGRGMVPGVRVGKQPYGILPATAYSRLAFPGGIDLTGAHGFADDRYLTALHQVLMRASGVWGSLTGGVSHVGKEGDPHQILLDVLGLHPSSVEFSSRHAESLAQVVNSLNLQGFGGSLAALLIAVELLDQGVDILRDAGYDVATSGRPQLLDKYFFGSPVKLAGDLVDDQPLSETDPVRPYTTDGRNYLAWLADAGRVSLETIRRQQGFTGDQPPSALLYLTLRHALLLGYYETGVRLYAAAEVLSPEELLATRREATFVHVAERPGLAESRWRLLYQRQPEVTGGREDLLVAEFIPMVLDEAFEAARLREQLAALDHLVELPTARLEGVFVEHLDTCGYRIDAWLQGLVQHQLTRMRGRGGQGVYLGAYGWLEDARPDVGRLEPVRLADDELRQIFERDDDPPLQRDPGNAGYVHAPSLNHAVTAAVLRNGYLTNAAPGEPGVFAVNLSSERVRRAIAIIEGMHGGQRLGALLGYQFERGLHDRHGQAEVDRFVYPLRKAFPLRADRLADTATDETIPITSIEARNVLDGVALVEHVQQPGNGSYPFGIDWLPDADPAAAAAINAEVARLLDTHDAVADLGMAEGVHQLLQGNYDRAAASTDAFGQGRLPPLPDVVQTPRSGVGLTHRIGLHLRPGLAPTHSPLPGVVATPRAAAEPAVNDWLAGLLPPPDRVAVAVRLADGTGLAETRTVTQEDLQLQPIDLLYLLTVQGDQAMTALDDRITLHLVGELRPDGTVTIAYTERLDDEMVSLFEVGALMEHLRALVIAARPLRATDLALPNEATGTILPAATWHTERLTHIRDGLAPPLDELRALAAELAPLLEDPVANEDALVDNVDTRLERFVDALAPLGLFGLPQTGLGFALDWKRGRYRALLRKVEELRVRWQQRLDRFQELANAYDILPPGTPDDQRFARLEELEQLVAVELTTPRPPTPLAYRQRVADRRDEFDAERTAYGNILATTTPALATLLEAIRDESADLTRFDHIRLDLDQDTAEIVRFSRDLLGAAQGLVADVDRRVAAVNEALAAHDAAVTDAAREAAATEAAQLLLAEDVLFLPEFTLPAGPADELQNAYDASPSLLDHLQSVEDIDFPVDDWLYGVARVRVPMGHWEAVTILADALTRAALELRPAQLPFLEGDSWLALSFPTGYQFEHDHLLYTAHYATPFVKTGLQCGLLLDEWTEIIPAREETTGVSFHYDRPNSEPPNVLLLATPPLVNGRWEWIDLVDTLHETLALAKQRAVEPDHLAGTDYARFLPATISAATYSPITIALNLARNNPGFTFDIGADNG